MIKGSLTVDEMRLIVAIGEIYAENHGAPMGLDELGEKLQARGFKVGKGMPRLIDDIEIKLGGRQSLKKLLLSRDRKGSEMLSGMQQLCQQFRVILDNLNEVEHTVSSGRLMIRIGLTNTLATNLFPRVLKESTFRKDFPNVDLEIIEGEPYELVQLLNSRVDFAIGPRNATNGFESKALCEWKRVLLYSRHLEYKHDLARAPSIETVREWIREEELMIPAKFIIPELDDFLKPMTTGRLMIVPQAAVRRLWVERELGLAISYEEKRSHLSLNDPVGTYDLSPVLGKTEMHLYQRPGIQLSPPAAFLVDAVTSIFKRELPEEYLSHAK